MRIAPPSFQFSDNRNSSMSQDFDRNIFSFSNGFERSEHQQQQIRRDKLRTQILEAPPPLVGMEEDGIQSYIFSDMFNYAPGGAAAATELLESQPYRNPREGDWFSHRQGPAAADGDFEDSKNQTVVNDTATYNRHQISSINPDSAAAMQLFLINPQQQQRRSTSPSPPPPSAGLHMSSSYHAAAAGGAFGQFTWAPNNPSEILEGQGLSLSLPPSEELRLGLLFGQTAPPQYGGGASQSRHLHVGFSGLSNSKYTKAAQELLQEFCNVGRSHFKKPKANKNPISGAAAGGGDSPSSSKDLPPVSASERLEHQRRKVKLSSMLDELDRRYNHYCERMQMVVNTFDMIMGYGAAAPYTMLAQKAMSRHFRCLREAISDQMRLSSEQLGEKDGAKSGLTKGETPRLKFLEQRLRQQRALHQMGGAAEQEAWRPQRGLPQRSLTILRAWLFEHFLHPYPSDADKHLLARQTGLSKNQVANWFINARVRLWKPMVEEMYLQEAKDQSEDQTATARIPTPTTVAAAAAVTPPPPAKINAHENDPSPLSFNTSENHPSDSNHVSPPTTTAAPPTNEAEACRKLPDGTGIESAMIRFGASSGDVSLTLGLRHDGNLPEKSYFSVRDFESY